MTSSSEQKVRTIIGTVISNKMDKTIRVKTERKVPDPLYGKYMKRSTVYFAHDEDNQCQMGDIVRITECRPLSKKKHWMLLEVMQKSNEEKL